MFRKRHLFAVALVIFVAVSIAAGGTVSDPNPWEFLSTSAIGADAFRKAHPEWDGRGVVIAILDTGIEPGVAGLRETTTGEPKILDFRDFTGEGDVSLEKAILESDANGDGLHGAEGPWLRGIEELSPPPDPGTIMIGYLREADLVNSAARDLDGNGRTNDIYGVVVYASGDMDGVGRRIVVDTDADWRLDDEEVRTDFMEDRRFFTVGEEGRREGVPLVSLALNLWEDDTDKVTFVFDDGAHGTHVSGIAAGHRIGGREGQDGIAPGAQLLALKLGDNTLSGGATVTGSMWKAWHYAIDYGRKNGVPVVIQMSYGIGSENEGDSDMEAEIDRLLEENEKVVACLSNGNAGPGISSAGLPSCARHVIATGAVLNRTTARDVYGDDLPGDFMFAFSSRGAEMAKPDVSAPGFAASTVPQHQHGRDVMAGTSMASPQSAGAAALLISAALAGDLEVVGAWVRTAMRRSAVPIPGATVLDQGPGMVNVTRAWDVYRALAARPAPEPLDWTVETDSPELPGGSGPAAHWRGIRPPVPPDAQEVKVTPRFRDRVTDLEKSEFYRAFDLVSTASWVRPEKKSVYTRASRPITFGLLYDRSALREPGLYTGRLLAYGKNLSRAERDKLGPEWDMPVSVVVPHTPSPGQVLSFDGVRLDPAAIERFHIRVPVGATGMEARMELPDGARQSVTMYIHDPEGRRVARPGAGNDSGSTAVHRLAGSELTAGVWEIVLYAGSGNVDPVTADLAVRFDALVMEAGPVSLQVVEGKPPEGKVVLTNRAMQSFICEAEALLTGYRLSEEMEEEGSTLLFPVHLGPELAGLDLRISMDAEDWNLFTDVAVQVLDGDGNAVFSSGMSNANLTVSFDNPDPGAGPVEYTLEINGGRANPEGGEPFTITLVRTYRYADPVTVEVTATEDDDGLVFHTDHPVELALECERTPQALPEGASWVVDMTITDARDGRKAAVLELEAVP